MKRVFSYLKKFPKGKIVVDSGYRDNSTFKINEYQNWKEFYPDAEEELPNDMPTPFGKAAQITVYISADHAHDTVTQCSVSAILTFVNNTPIWWHSKKQKTVETSTYGAELVTARIAVNMVIELQYMLRMLGVPVDSPSLMLGDNNSVVLNTLVPSSILKKKHHVCAYHQVHEAIASGIVNFVYIWSETIYADMLSKPLANDAFHNLMKPLLFQVPKAGRAQES